MPFRNLPEPETPVDEGQPSEHYLSQRKRSSRKFSRYFLLFLLITVMALFINMVKIFLVPVLLAAVFSTLFFPLYNALLRRMRNRRGLAAFFCCLILLVGLLVPIYIVAHLVSREAVSFYQTAEKKIQEMIVRGDEGPLGAIKHSRIFRALNLSETNWQDLFREIAGSAGSVLASVIKRTSSGAFQIFTNVFVTLFIMFYFFRDGEALLARIKLLIPLTDRYEDAIMKRFVAVSRATFRGTLIIGLIQSSIGAVTLWALGVQSPVLWWVVMLVLSQIPIVGAWFVMHPAALIQILLGHVWQGILIFLITIFVISTIDNFLRPRLVGRQSGMHDLLVFFSTLGGISMFGAMGVIVGPVIGALFLTILDIYGAEFRSQLDLARSRPTTPEIIIDKPMD